MAACCACCRFQEDAHDDVADFAPEQFQELARWRDFYAKHAEYKAVGRVVGRFFDAQGAPTALRLRAEAAAAAAAESGGAADGEQQQQQQKEEAAGDGDGVQQEQGGSGGSAGGTPLPCNVKWSKAEGGSLCLVA